MRLRRVPEARSLVDAHFLTVTEQDALGWHGRWRELFADAGDQPLHLEIGMGQGHFLHGAALEHTKINYLGLERRAEPIMWLLKGLTEPYLPNLRIIRAEAALLTEMFATAELDTIYLFFPDPWPKARHAKRRLSAPTFIQEYQRILKPAGHLHFKTDSTAFFQWTCESFIEAGWHAEQSSPDKLLCSGEITTYYEQRFRDRGQEIYYAVYQYPR
ncbi:MAG: tRNA (guanosine(46)-N7)-methyltransferase TrmB [Clostridiales bacterium]|nr:tRNA (guanosine(46)-N7)-methyltransferase TrmB [Clostridiales bacterium]